MKPTNSPRARRVRSAVAALCFLVVVAPSALAQDGGSVVLENRKVLMETEHFGDFYSPDLIVAGGKVNALFRPNVLRNTLERFVMTSKNAGKKFGKPRHVKNVGLSYFFQMTGDAAGTPYVVGTLGGAVAISKGDAKLKRWTVSAPVDVDDGVVAAEIAIGPDGRIHLVVQRQFSVYTSQGWQNTDQLFWTVSTDGGATFGEPVALSDRYYQWAEYEPALAVGPDGAVWLVHARDSLEARVTSGDAFAGGSIFVRRLDTTAPEVELPRGVADGRIDFLDAVAAPGGVRVLWAELDVNAPQPIQKTYFVRYDQGTAPVAPTAPLTTVGSPSIPQLARTASGRIAVFATGAGFDGPNERRAFIALGSADDGLTFGSPKRYLAENEAQVTNSILVTSDAENIYGVWTDTRQVVFASFAVAP